MRPTRHPYIRFAFAAVLLLGFLLPQVALAGGGLDVRKWLERPGVRLVVVEFYATWCKPCMEAVPKWKKLHEKYRNEGLRLVVVNTLDPEGRCLNPGWNPDQMICDEEGQLAEMLGVGNSLPAAFLWSWQGDLLVRQGHVREVERVVKRYLKGLPRVAIQAKGEEASFVENAVTEQLTRVGKLKVVTGSKERKILKKLKKESRKANYDDSMACELGKDVPANSLLKAEVYGKKRSRRLALTLHSVETGCALASATAPWNERQPTISVAEATDKLLQALQPSLELPGDEKKPSREVVDTGPSFADELGASLSATVDSAFDTESPLRKSSVAFTAMGATPIVGVGVDKIFAPNWSGGVGFGGWPDFGWAGAAVFRYYPKVGNGWRFFGESSLAYMSDNVATGGPASRSSGDGVVSSSGAPDPEANGVLQALVGYEYRSSLVLRVKVGAASVLGEGIYALNSGVDLGFCY